MGNSYRDYDLGYPTLEDVLDINFRSIVSDCRAIYAGTLVPRPWSDISETWMKDESASRNHPLHASEKAKKNMVRAQALHHMTRILRANGKGESEARQIAKELLGM